MSCRKKPLIPLKHKIFLRWKRPFVPLSIVSCFTIRFMCVYNKRGLKNSVCSRINCLCLVNVEIWQQGLMTFDLSQPLEVPVGSSLRRLMSHWMHKSQRRLVFDCKFASKNKENKKIRAGNAWNILENIPGRWRTLRLCRSSAVVTVQKQTLVFYTRSLNI